MESLYWDDFKRREIETVECIKNGSTIPVRRVAVFITELCNFKCSYCNVQFTSKFLSKARFEELLEQYGNTALFHITGGEPSVIKWLYPLIEERTDIRFHLNTNAYRLPPMNIQRLKVSLDTTDAQYFDSLVGVRGAFNRVVKNIKLKSSETITSVTCTLTKENYKSAPEFMAFCRQEFPDLYATFFSIYKGTNERFKINKADAEEFFNVVRPELEKEMDTESLNLFTETIDNKRRLITGKKFPEITLDTPCYLSLSERVISPEGNEYFCSHLYRDGILKAGKHKLCQYGCNRRLAKFNEDVADMLNEK